MKNKMHKIITLCLVCSFALSQGVFSNANVISNNSDTNKKMVNKIESALNFSPKVEKTTRVLSSEEQKNDLKDKKVDLYYIIDTSFSRIDTLENTNKKTRDWISNFNNFNATYFRYDMGNGGAASTSPYVSNDNRLDGNGEVESVDKTLNGMIKKLKKDYAFNANDSSHILMFESDFEDFFLNDAINYVGSGKKELTEDEKSSYKKELEKIANRFNEELGCQSIFLVDRLNENLGEDRIIVKDDKGNISAIFADSNSDRDTSLTDAFFYTVKNISESTIETILPYMIEVKNSDFKGVEVSNKNDVLQVGKAIEVNSKDEIHLDVTPVLDFSKKGLNLEVQKAGITVYACDKNGNKTDEVIAEKTLSISPKEIFNPAFSSQVITDTAKSDNVNISVDEVTKGPSLERKFKARVQPGYKITNIYVSNYDEKYFDIDNTNRQELLSDQGELKNIIKPLASVYSNPLKFSYDDVVKENFNEPGVVDFTIDFKNMNGVDDKAGKIITFVVLPVMSPDYIRENINTIYKPQSSLSTEENDKIGRTLKLNEQFVVNEGRAGFTPSEYLKRVKDIESFKNKDFANALENAGYRFTYDKANLIPLGISESRIIAVGEPSKSDMNEGGQGRIDTKYEADPSMKAGEKKVVQEGKSGWTKHTEYKFNKKMGKFEIDEEKSSAQSYTVLGIVKVGTKPEVSEKVIPMTTKYKADYNKNYGDDEIKKGKDGKEKITKTFTLNEKTGELTAKEEKTTLDMIPSVVTKGAKLEKKSVVIKHKKLNPKQGFSIVKGEDGKKDIVTVYKLNEETGEIVTENKETVIKKAIDDKYEKLLEKTDKVETEAPKTSDTENIIFMVILILVSISGISFFAKRSFNHKN